MKIQPSLTFGSEGCLAFLLSYLFKRIMWPTNVPVFFRNRLGSVWDSTGWSCYMCILCIDLFGNACLIMRSNWSWDSLHEESYGYLGDVFFFTLYFYHISHRSVIPVYKSKYCLCIYNVGGVKLRVFLFVMPMGIWEYGLQKAGCTHL